MPYLEINTSVTLSDAEKHDLCEEIGKCLPLIPEKTRDLTIMNINDRRFMELGDADPSLVVELRIGGTSPNEAKADFVREVTALFERTLGISPKRVYVNIFECDTWGANGQFFY
jgi:phenylpyruvate tautomerase PptA (4-oxalocrotonate tautomerase family)